MNKAFVRVFLLIYPCDQVEKGRQKVRAKRYSSFFTLASAIINRAFLLVCNGSGNFFSTQILLFLGFCVVSLIVIVAMTTQNGK